MRPLIGAPGEGARYEDVRPNLCRVGHQRDPDGEFVDRPGELRATSKQTDQHGRVTSWVSFAYDGDTGVLSLGDHQLGLPGQIVMGVAGSGSQSVLLDSATNMLALGGSNAGNGTVRLKTRVGTEAAVMSGELAT